MAAKIPTTQIKELYLSGLSTIKIGRLLGLSEPTISRRLSRAGCPTRCAEAREKLLNKSELLKQLYLNEELTGYEIARKLDCKHSLIYDRLRKLGILRTNSEAHKAHSRKNPRPKKETILPHAGYIWRLAPNHPRAYSGGYVLEHILVWEEYHKQRLPEGWHIHHINAIKTDNRPSNLFGLSPSKHQKKHATLLEERAKKIRELEIENRQLKQALENSQMIFYISEN